MLCVKNKLFAFCGEGGGGGWGEGSNTVRLTVNAWESWQLDAQ